MEIKIRTFASGVDETIRELRRKGEHVLKAAKRELKYGADDIVKDAKSLCPSPHTKIEGLEGDRRTGNLNNSIKATPEKQGAIYRISASAIGQNGVDYSRYVEFDPRIATPYMYPALKHNRDRLKKRIDTAIIQAVNGK